MIGFLACVLFFFKFYFSSGSDWNSTPGWPLLVSPLLKVNLGTFGPGENDDIGQFIFLNWDFVCGDCYTCPYKDQMKQTCDKAADLPDG